MLGRLRDRINEVIDEFEKEDFTVPSVQHAPSCESTIDQIISSYDYRIAELKKEMINKMNKITNSIQDLVANFDGKDRSEKLKQKHAEMSKIEQDYENEVDRIRQERERELLAKAKSDEEEIRRVQCEEEEEIHRVEEESRLKIDKIRQEMNNEIARTYKESKLTIDRIRKDKESRLNKFIDEYQTLKDKYKSF